MGFLDRFSQTWSIFILVSCFVGPPLIAGSSGCWGGHCLSESYVSYYDRNVGGTINAWPITLKNWGNDSSMQQMVAFDFAEIRGKFQATGVRLQLSLDPKWGYPSPSYPAGSYPPGSVAAGVGFPNPTSADLAKFNSIVDVAAKQGLKVFLVIVIPFQYLAFPPTALDVCVTPSDPCYANNGVSLEWNVFNFWTAVIPTLFESIGPDGQARGNHISHVSMGEYDPLNVYGASPYGSQWLTTLWPGFYSWFGGIIPQSEKSFELVGYTSNPLDPQKGVAAQIQWAKSNFGTNFPPSRYSFEAYSNYAWYSSYPSASNPAPWLAFQTLFANAANAAGGSAHLMVEEIGVNNCLNAPSNDNAGGETTFSAAFSQLVALDSNVPIGVWGYGDSTCNANGEFGLIDSLGNFRQGWWTLPYFFGF